MHDDEDLPLGTLELLVNARIGADEANRSVQERAEEARVLVDDARLALAQLAQPAVKIIALRLAGATVDWTGKPVTDEREETAWEVLSRTGIPRLRAAAIAASIAASTHAPAPDSPGWVDPDADEDDDEVKELDPATIEGQIEAFIAGARAQRDLGAAS